MNQQAVELFFKTAPESQKRRYDIIVAILNGEGVTSISQRFDVARSYVNRVKQQCQLKEVTQ
ncbi:hypothetical protein VCRA217O317_30225 [Vibrio crassostreae]|nr:hypothetical protein VCRA2117O328_40067 [Vibrio crassostreae]CAK2504168.1 hypothetical protein VCRA2110O319_50068 [Vibrio crassostreae]CAK2908676.1 hypothetical protein VCRA217O317_30225 [Vibrio crassostreae]